MDGSDFPMEKPHAKIKAKNGMNIEEQRLARLVKRKLEDYMNKTKRENHFDPAGVHRTTVRMHKYDFMYKVIEATALEELAKRKQMELKKNGQLLSLCIKWLPTQEDAGVSAKCANNSRQVTRGLEALHLSQAASSVLAEVPVHSLTSLHGVRAGRGGRGLRLQGYTSHVGAVLHGKKYADYYRTQGLNTGNSSRTTCLIDLKMRDQPESSSSYTNSTVSGGSSACSNSTLSRSSHGPAESTLSNGNRRQTNSTLSISSSGNTESTVSKGPCGSTKSTRSRGSSGNTESPQSKGSNGYTESPPSKDSNGHTESPPSESSNGYTESPPNRGSNGYAESASSNASNGHTESASSNASNGHTESASTNDNNGHTESPPSRSSNGYTESARSKSSNGYTESPPHLGSSGHSACTLSEDNNCDSNLSRGSQRKAAQIQKTPSKHREIANPSQERLARSDGSQVDTRMSGLEEPAVDNTFTEVAEQMDNNGPSKDKSTQTDLPSFTMTMHNFDTTRERSTTAAEPFAELGKRHEDSGELLAMSSKPFGYSGELLGGCLEQLGDSSEPPDDLSESLGQFSEPHGGCDEVHGGLRVSPGIFKEPIGASDEPLHASDKLYRGALSVTSRESDTLQGWLGEPKDKLDKPCKGSGEPLTLLDEPLGSVEKPLEAPGDPHMGLREPLQEVSKPLVSQPEQEEEEEEEEETSVGMENIGAGDRDYSEDGDYSEDFEEDSSDGT